MLYAFYTSTKKRKFITITNALSGWTEYKEYNVTGLKEARLKAKELGAIAHNY